MLNRLLVSLFFLLPLFSVVSPATRAETDLAISAEEKTLIEDAIDKVVFSMIDKDIDALMKLTRLDALFQFEKKEKLSKFLLRYVGADFKMSNVETFQIRKIKPDEIKAMVKVYLTAQDAIGGLGAAPRAEVWRFVKGTEGEERDKWFFLIEDQSKSSK